MMDNYREYAASMPPVETPNTTAPYQAPVMAHSQLDSKPNTEEKTVVDHKNDKQES
ncbi:MAG: hypothetical protein HWD59_12590 [Coxiellaceae bacterium]|nr:MAG: hypothetical protein HWD59_12590 [Coxiellaceae bacterium]